MTDDDEHEANLERNREALIAQLRRMQADHDSDAFEEFAVSMSVWCGAIVLNLNALAGDRAGIAVLTEVDDHHLTTAGGAIISIMLHAFDLIRKELDD